MKIIAKRCVYIRFMAASSFPCTHWTRYHISYLGPPGCCSYVQHFQTSVKWCNTILCSHTEKKVFNKQVIMTFIASSICVFSTFPLKAPLQLFTLW